VTRLPERSVIRRVLRGLADEIGADGPPVGVPRDRRMASVVGASGWHAWPHGVPERRPSTIAA